MHRIACSLLFLVAANLLVGAARAEPYAVTFESDVEMKTRDGVRSEEHTSELQSPC